VHLLRGNQHGAKTLLRRGAGRLKKYDDGHLGIPTAALAGATLEHADRIEAAELAGEPGPSVAFPKI
jgi:hypothetical protein